MSGDTQASPSLNDHGQWERVLASIDYLKRNVNTFTAATQLAINGVIGHLKEQEERVGLMMKHAELATKEIERLTEENRVLIARIGQADAKLRGMDRKVDSILQTMKMIEAEL